MPENNISISVVIPCFNEEKYIEKCISSLLNQKKIGNNFEIIIVDGMSTDGTREILNKISHAFEQVKVIDNQKKITPAAFNLGIKKARGEYICIMGAHSEYDEHYLYNCLLLFQQHLEVSCVGGPIISKGKNNFAEAAAAAMSSSIGVGNAKHRFPDYEGFAEMACFPMFKKSVFEEIGYYDETLVRNQDDEFCFRLRLNGGKIYISPTVKSEYYVRDKPGKLFKQYFDYGKWRIAVLKKHKIPISFRQFIPAAFFLLVIIFAMISFLTDNLFIGLLLPVTYMLVLFLFTLKNMMKKKMAVALNIPLAVFILHFSYAAGFIFGLLKAGNK